MLTKNGCPRRFLNLHDTLPMSARFLVVFFETTLRSPFWRSGSERIFEIE